MKAEGRKAAQLGGVFLSGEWISDRARDCRKLAKCWCRTSRWLVAKSITCACTAWRTSTNNRNHILQTQRGSTYLKQYSTSFSVTTHPVQSSHESESFIAIVPKDFFRCNLRHQSHHPTLTAQATMEQEYPQHHLVHPILLRRHYDRLRNSRIGGTTNLTYKRSTKSWVQYVSSASPMKPSINTEMNKACSSSSCCLLRSYLSSLWWLSMARLKYLRMNMQTWERSGFPGGLRCTLRFGVSFLHSYGGLRNGRNMTVWFWGGRHTCMTLRCKSLNRSLGMVVIFVLISFG